MNLNVKAKAENYPFKPSLSCLSPSVIPPSRLLVSLIVTARTKKAAFLADTQSQQACSTVCFLMTMTLTSDYETAISHPLLQWIPTATDGSRHNM